MIETNRVIQGDTLEVLKKMDSESVNCIVTSPPYWGLRDYGKETNMVFGGDKNCEHEWGKENIINRGHPGDKSTLVGTQNANISKSANIQGQFCSKCGAWHGQLGLEPTLDMFLDHLLSITSELKRVLRKDGVMFWNHGDSYGGSWQNYGARDGGQRSKNTRSFNRPGNPTVLPPTAWAREKCMMLQNYRLLIRMVDGQKWIARNLIIWNKPNHMPSSVKDRFSNSYEPVFMFVKNKKYWFDLDAVRKPHQAPLHNHGNKNRVPLTHHFDEPNRVWGSELGKNPGDVWTIPTQPFPEAHFAVFPEKLIEPMIKSGCPKGSVVLDPFSGSGTTCVVARKLRRRYIGIELNPNYIQIAQKRLSKIPVPLTDF